MMKTTTRCLVALGLLATARPAARAQAPANDDPCGAILLATNGNLCTAPTVSTNAGATPTVVAGHQNPTPGCTGGGPAPHDVWYVFQTAATGLGSFGATITVTGNPAGQLRLYDVPACTGPFTLIACSAAATANTAAPRLVTGALRASTYYYVAVNGYADTDQAGAFTICLTDGPGVPACGAPYFLGAGSINATSAQIGFRDGATGTGPYQAVVTGGGTTQTVTATASPLRLTGLLAATTYQVTLTGVCTGGGATPGAGFSFTTPTAYCTAGLGGSCTDNTITGFALLNTSLGNTAQIPTCNDGRGSNTAGVPAYTYYPPTARTTATLLAGTTYQVSVSVDGPSSVAAWLDADHNGAFDTYEFTQLATYTQNGQASVAPLTVPATAVPGPTGLRIRSRTAGSPNSAGAACVNFLSGEVEDYTVTIAMPTATGSSAKSGGPSAYPNPAAGRVSIAYTRNPQTNKPGHLYVRDVLGRLVHEQLVPLNPTGLTELPVSHWPNGVYTYHISWEDTATNTGKFLVQH